MADVRARSHFSTLGPVATAAVLSIAACSGDGTSETSPKGSGGSSAGAAGSAGSARDGGGVGGVGGIGGLGGVGGSAGMDASTDGSMAGSGGDDGGTPDASVDGPTFDASDGAADAPTDVPLDAACGAGSKMCGGLCVSVNDADFGCTPTDCDPCSIPNAGASCFAGACRLQSCNSGFADCNGIASDGCETNLGSDAANCGACGNACVVANATAACSGGSCAVASCNSGFDDCDTAPSNGCESDTQEDPNNCNTCGNTCSAGGGASPDCNGGSCAIMLCPIGLADCNDDTSDGCETNLGTSPDHCGYCNRTCDLPNATASCNGGDCLVASCDPGFDDCDGNHANGCETDVTSNALHCGECSRACETSGATSARCAAGECFQVCDAGTDDCQHPTAPTADDGCETSTSSDTNNCGSCGNTCTSPTGTPACSGGICTIADCPTDTGDCDGDISNGCETDLNTDENHCGACMRPCSTSGVIQRSCNNGLCVSGCESGLGNCNRPAAPAPDDGCEKDVTSDVENCGACNRRCATDNVLSLECSSGQCLSSCQLGFANCTQPALGLADDGCELQFNLASLNCGSCDNDCSVQGGGGSGLKCSAPITLNCGCAGNDGRCRTGGSGGTCNISTLTCECGGTACRPGEACAPGPSGDVCECNSGTACASGEVCCQTPAGCRDLMTDATSCGACGRACPPGFVCDAGACECSGNDSCDAGSSGACTSGACQCGAGACAPGQRCLPDGTCG